MGVGTTESEVVAGRVVAVVVATKVEGFLLEIGGEGS